MTEDSDEIQGVIPGQENAAAEPDPLAHIPHEAMTAFIVIETTDGFWMADSHVKEAVERLTEIRRESNLADFIIGANAVRADAERQVVVSQLSQMLEQIPGATAQQMMAVGQALQQHAADQALGRKLLRAEQGRPAPGR